MSGDVWQYSEIMGPGTKFTEVQWSLSITVTHGPKILGLIGEVAGIGEESSLDCGPHPL